MINFFFRKLVALSRQILRCDAASFDARKASEYISSFPSSQFSLLSLLACSDQSRYRVTFTQSLCTLYNNIILISRKVVKLGMRWGNRWSYLLRKTVEMTLYLQSSLVAWCPFSFTLSSHLLKNLYNAPPPNC